MITDVRGVRVGHWTDRDARTGCTVVLLPPGSVASGEVRGGAPATREVALLEPHRLVEHVDAVVLSGGSAFGLAACDGVVQLLEEQGVGFATGAGPVPIVVGLSLFDLLVGDGARRPGPAEGRAATLAASDGPFELGAVGAGTGATFDKWRGREHAQPGGLGSATVRSAGVTVSALVALNAYGGLAPAPGEREPADPTGHLEADVAFGNTTIGVVVTDAALDKVGCHLVSQGGHDGIARALYPPHTRVDGDAIVAVATREVDAPVDMVRAMAVLAVERAVRSAASAGVQTPGPQ